MSITFAVDDVVPAPAPRAVFPLAERLGAHDALGAPVDQVIDAPPVHPLLAAVHVAFAEHRPLLLSPDAIWLTLAQGVALHVRLHAETLRARLVRHEGVEKLTVQVPELPHDAAGWTRAVSGFRAALAEHVGEGRARLFGCDFSTTTPAAAVAGDIVLMDVFAPYFAYELFCVCGIPSITLTGTPADWRAIRARLDVIDELYLGFWTAALRPIVDALVATAEGRPDVEFWRGIYKPAKAYGGERVTGWIARLFPYVGGSGRFDTRNPMLVAGGDVDGIRTSQVPLGTSQVLIELVDAVGGRATRDVVLEGGLVAVGQDESGRLEPVAGWMARPPAVSIAATLARLRRAHRAEPFRAPPNRLGVTGPIEIVTIFRELHEATLFDGARAWHLRPYDAHEQVHVRTASNHLVEVSRVLDLPDGSCVALARGEYHRPVWVRLQLADLAPPYAEAPDPLGIVTLPVRQKRTTAQHASTVPVLQGTLADVLSFALDGGDAAQLPTTGEHLIDVLSPMYRTPRKSAEEREAESAEAGREPR